MLRASVVVRTANMKIPRPCLGDYVQKIAPKSVPCLQHDYFSSFSQSNHWFVALSLSSSFLKLKLRTDDGDGGEDRWEFAYVMSKNNVYCTRYTPRTCVSLHFDIYV